MRALVTGASGFIGSYLTERLLNNGDTVAVLHRPESDLWRIRPHLPRIVSIVGDMASLSDARAQIEAFGPEIIFHLAWRGVSNRHRNDECQLTLNLHPTLELARMARELGCRAWIGLGSQAEYGPQADIIDEKRLPHPTTMYGAVKLSACFLTRQILSDSDTRFAWLRLFSSYGPKDGPDWMLPSLIGALLRSERPALTAGEQKWDYIYAADAAEAIARTAESPRAHGIYNLGSGSAYRLRAVVEQIRDIIDPMLPLGFGEVPYRTDQVMHLQADISRLRRDTGWQPETSLEDGIRQTVAWYTERLVSCATTS